MKTAKTISVLGIMAMTAVLIYGFTAGDFGSDGFKITPESLGLGFYGGFIYRLYPVFHVDYLPREIPYLFIDLVVLMHGFRILHRQSLYLHRSY